MYDSRPRRLAPVADMIALRKVAGHDTSHTVWTCGLSEVCNHTDQQATGLDAWASRVKCPAQFVSH